MIFSHIQNVGIPDAGPAAHNGDSDAQTVTWTHGSEKFRSLPSSTAYPRKHKAGPCPAAAV